MRLVHVEKLHESKHCCQNMLFPERYRIFTRPQGQKRSGSSASLAAPSSAPSWQTLTEQLPKQKCLCRAWAQLHYAECQRVGVEKGGDNLIASTVFSVFQKPFQLPLCSKKLYHIYSFCQSFQRCDNVLALAVTSLVWVNLGGNEQGPAAPVFPFKWSNFL